MIYFKVVRLLYYLVMFGYYMDAEDVENLLPPLLNLLDGRKDFPVPKDKEKGKQKIKIKLRPFQSSEHINEKGVGPYCIFGYFCLSHGAKENYCNFASFNVVVETKTSIIQM